MWKVPDLIRKSAGPHEMQSLSNFAKTDTRLSLQNSPCLDYLVPAYYVLTTAEASSNLARYDGMPLPIQEVPMPELILNQAYKKSRSEGFGPEVKRRIMLGTFVLRRLLRCVLFQRTKSASTASQ
jgi:Asp-tRNA(Asn)/Glu-tRNA(Gln) amidotransferase A subunit family amidase